MKSFVAYPTIVDKKAFSKTSNKLYSEKLLTHYQSKKTSSAEGYIVKCGITSAEGFKHFAIFSSLIHVQSIQNIVAFEKTAKDLYFENRAIKNSTLLYKAKPAMLNVEKIKNLLREKGIDEPVNFIRGNVWDSIPEYLIKNPDLKIAYLNIDMDDFDGTLTALQFFYPRLVHGGILVLDNYYKKQEDYRAIEDYFTYSNVEIKSLYINEGPHYLIRK